MIYLLDCFLLRCSVECMVETITLLYFVFYILIYIYVLGDNSWKVRDHSCKPNIYVSLFTSELI